MLISVITPTYNRAYILRRCYESLIAQTNTNFEWIVVDDGSTDDTEKLIRQFIEEKKVNITYVKQTNGGKHRAHNTAVSKAKGELCVCLDSDDALAPNAIARCIERWESRNEKDAIGLFALRGNFINHEPICSHIPIGVTCVTMGELRDQYKFEGDSALFFQTSVLRNHPFVTFEGERFITEISLYSQLDRIGPMILMDEVLYYCEYLPDGLTKQYLKILKENPLGTAYTYYQMSVNSKRSYLKIKYAIIACAYRSLAKENAPKAFHIDKPFVLLAYFLAPIYRRIKGW